MCAQGGAGNHTPEPQVSASIALMLRRPQGGLSRIHLPRDAGLESWGPRIVCRTCFSLLVTLKPSTIDLSIYLLSLQAETEWGRDGVG